MSIIRPEFLLRQQHKHLGAVSVSRPLSMWLVLVLIIVFFVVVFAFSIFVSYSRKAHVPGIVTPTGGVIKITAPATGRLAMINVAEGDLINTLDPLAQLLLEKNLPEGGVRSIQGKLISAKKSELMTTIALKRELQKQRTHQLENTIDSIDRQIEQLKFQRELQSHRVEAAQQHLDRYAELSRQGFISKIQVDERRDSALEQAFRSKDVELAIRAAERQLNETKAELKSQPALLAMSETEINRQLAELEQEDARSRAENELILKSPIRGTVSAVVGQNGQSVKDGQTVLSILPLNSLFEVNLFVPVERIGQVEVGQKVVLRYSAFPFEKYGQYIGTIQNISKTLVTTAEAAYDGGKTGQGEDKPVYRVAVKLKTQTVRNGSSELNLRAGMQVDADIILESRTLFEWAFSPVIGFLRKIST